MIKRTLLIIGLLGLIGISEKAEAVGDHCLCQFRAAGDDQELCVGSLVKNDACRDYCVELFGNTVKANTYNTCISYRAGTGCECG